MPVPEIRSAKDLLAVANATTGIRLDCSVIHKGIDNFAIDIELDSNFLACANQAIEEITNRVTSGRRGELSSDLADRLRDAYEDMVTVSLHRTKTGFPPEQVRICQFAIVKYVVARVRDQLNNMVREVEETLGRQQFAAARGMLVTQAKFSSLRRNFVAYQYRITRTIFRVLQREENSQLRQLRDQFLGKEMSELPDILFNPMLAVTSPATPQLMLDSYMVWSGSLESLGEAIASVEKFLGSRITDLPMVPMKPKQGKTVGETEIYDKLGGLFGSQPILGGAADQKDNVNERLCWLDQPDNIRLFFDPAVHDRLLENMKGIGTRIKFRSLAARLRKIGKAARSKFVSEAIAREMVAGYIIRDEWRPAYEEMIDPAQACAYVAGNDARRIISKVDISKEGATLLMRRMDDWAKELNRRFKDENDEFWLRILTDMSRFRMHLKYFRFAHRMFNRLNVVTDPQQIQMASAGGHLYQLLGADQSKMAKSTEPAIVHHTIIKADVRGSTVVTAELIKQNLNPASYFSTRLFDPITQLLEVYGAVKVFIEGDAVILSIYEHDLDPQNWYSVSRACGIAKEIIDIVSSKNAHARQSGIPLLEIGIGICYSDDKPMFLFDDDKPIMISSAIGKADRMSSCSWNLREAYADDQFNVEVLEIAEGERQRGEKGQHYIQYNVDGIMLDTDAFQKLKSEIRLRKLRVKIGRASQTMYVGQFPDLIGKGRDLVIREGIIGLWRNGKALPGQEGGQPFYEVLPNSKFVSQVLEMARSQGND